MHIMASPESVTIHNVVGDWQLVSLQTSNSVKRSLLTIRLRQNKELSDDLEAAVVIQGVPYLICKLMRLATVSERISETTKPDGTKVLVVAKSAAGLSGQADTFDPSGEEHLVDGGYFGPKVRVRS